MCPTPNHGWIDSSTTFDPVSAHYKRASIEAVHETLPDKNVLKFFFSQRVVDSRNSLPSNILESPSINMFKNRLDDYISRNGRL